MIRRQLRAGLIALLVCLAPGRSFAAEIDITGVYRCEGTNPDGSPYQGLVRIIGVTGHGWTIAAMHKRSLERFDFDSLLLPYNYVMYGNERYREDFDAVLHLCEERQVAVQTIKAIARGPWATTDKMRNTWYQPLEEQADIDRAVHWVIGRPGIFLNTAGDIQLLPKILDAASRYDARPSDDAMTAMLEKQCMTTLFGLGPSSIR